MKRKFAFFLIILILISANFCHSSVEAPSDTDQKLLDEVERRALAYFIRERNPENGLIRDWAWNASGESVAPATIAATGFALTAYGIGVERGWLSRNEALSMTRRALEALQSEIPNDHGFYYHLLNFKTGARGGSSELSPIDTGLAVAGILFAGEYYQDPEIKQLADSIVNRVDWPWMLNGGKFFSLASSPERGFEKKRWDHFDESLLIYLIAMGSPAHPVSEEGWKALRRPVGSYSGYRSIIMPPLFTHQYPHVWFDFRDKHDGFADYFENSRQATLIQQKFAMDQSKKFKSYGPDSWGLTATEGPAGYKAYGAPPGWSEHDGTVAPTACVSSMPFTPEESMACLRFLYGSYKNKFWGRYGFGDSFNLSGDWFNPKVYAINQGPMMLMIENYRTGFVWRVMNRIPAVQEAFRKAGFRKGTMALPWPDPPVLEAVQSESPVRIDGLDDDWQKISGVKTYQLDFVESGFISENGDLAATIRFAWDADSLYAFARIEDDSLVMKSQNQMIWRDDLLELFIDPKGDGLFWGGDSDFQLGLRPVSESAKTIKWSWFKSKGPDLEGVYAAGRVREKGYQMEIAIDWNFIGIQPVKGLKFGLSPAVHDIDRDRTEGKVSTFLRNEEKPGRFQLSILELD